MFPEAERRCLGKEGSEEPMGRLGALWWGWARCWGVRVGMPLEGKVGKAEMVYVGEGELWKREW